MGKIVVKTAYFQNYEEPKYLTSDCESSRKNNGQATKSTRGMPWHREPMKDVTNCDKPRGAVSERYIRGFPNGAIRQEESLVIIC